MPPVPSRVKEVFFEAAEIASANDRTAFLDRACHGDTELRKRVDDLLSAHGQPDKLLDQSIVERLANDTDPDTDPQAVGDEVDLGFLESSDKPGSMGRLAHYEVIRLLGRGGMGIVLRAFDEKLHRAIAIKALAPQLATNPKARLRFVREARAAAAIMHENVVAIHAVEDAGPVPYIVMQCVDGKTLQEKIDEPDRFELGDILRIGGQIAGGLAAAHKHGLIHRDIKPANILLEEGVERVRITDFGLARSVDDTSLTQSGYIAGTPMYMSPEQARSERPDHRSDLFSLGSVLYALCTGKPPFPADHSMAVLKRVCEDRPIPIREINPEIPSWLEAIVEILLAKNPADRFQSADEVATLLNQRLGQLRSGSESTSAERRLAVNLDKRLAALREHEDKSQKSNWPWIGLALACAAVSVWVIHKQSVDVPAPPIVEAKDKTESKPTGPLILKPTRTLTQHTGGVMAVAFSPDGKILASGGQDRSILLWDTTTWKAGNPIEAHPGDVDGLAFLPDGKRLASITSIKDDCQVRLWDAATAGPAGTLGNSVPGLFALEVAADGKILAVGGWDRQVHLWDTTSWKERPAIKDVVTRHVRGLSFSPDGKSIVTGGSGPTRVWDVETGREIPTAIKMPEGMCPTFLPDGRTIVGWTHGGGRVTICDFPEGRIRAAWRAHPKVIEGLIVSRDGNLLVSFGNDGMARIWSIADQTELATLVGHKGSVYSAAFSPDGRLLATAGVDDLSVRLWEIPENLRVISRQLLR